MQNFKTPKNQKNAGCLNIFQIKFFKNFRLPNTMVSLQSVELIQLQTKIHWTIANSPQSTSHTGLDHKHQMQPTTFPDQKHTSSV